MCRPAAIRPCASLRWKSNCHSKYLKSIKLLTYFLLLLRTFCPFTAQGLGGGCVRRGCFYSCSCFQGHSAHLLQRFQRFGVKQEIQKADIGYAVIVVSPRLEGVVSYNNLSEGVASVTKREDLLFSFLGGGDGICRLNVHLPRTTIDDKVDFILSKHMFPRSEIMALHNSNVNGISTAVHTLLEPGFVAEGWFWYNS